MALPIYRLRRLLAVTAVLLSAAVTGMYLYARLRTRDIRKGVTEKIGIDIKQTARGFQFSKSDGKRTLFSVQATDVKQFKLNGHAELHNVSIILYGRDSSRYDQIYGDDFAYEPKTGEITAKGTVQIDLVANPEGAESPDQSAPKNVKNTIHLKTRDLIFNRNTGDAATDARVDFETPQATGWAVGVRYEGKSNTLTLSSQVHLQVSGPNAAVITASDGVITNQPREIVLDHPELERQESTMRAEQAAFHLSPDNTVESIFASGNVTMQARTETKRIAAQQVVAHEDTGQKEGSEITARADQAELLLAGKQNLLRAATLTGKVHVEETGERPMQGDAGRVILQFKGQNQLEKVHATDGARLLQTAKSENRPSAGSGAQNFELTAPTIDFHVTDGRFLESAETSGAAKIVISGARDGPSVSQAAAEKAASLERASSARAASTRAAPAQPASPQTTVVTAGKFEARFATAEGRTYPTLLHGAPDARIVNSTPGQPDRVSTSEAVDATFLAAGGMESVTQKGNVVYTDNQPAEKRVQAWSNSARYTPSDQILVLTGNPRVQSGAMLTTAKTVRINRSTNAASAETDVKSTYSELKEQPNGALLASSSPIHVTAHAMTAENNPGVAVYTGNARLWQDANVIEAPSIQFDRENRSVIAQAAPGHSVQTTLVTPEKNGGAKPGGKPSSPGSAGDPGLVTVTARELIYTDADRKAHYEGEVQAKGTDFKAASKTLDAYLRPRGEVQEKKSLASPSQLDHMVAEGDVLVEEPGRRAEGQKLVYTAAEDKFVLTGGSPSIFDAEQGKITGVSLTFFRRDDRVLVEGEASSPVVTRTRVAR